MLVSVKWLKKWVNFTLDDEHLSNCLTMAGLEVDSINPINVCDNRVVVGRIIQIKSHPTRSSLKVCLVDAGLDNPLQVICGAPNVELNQYYPLALPDSTVGEKSVEEREIYGETSSGILCSANELGLGESSDLLMELDSSAPVGCSINEYLDLPDSVLNIELTPNRADCLSIGGVAREVAIIANETLISPQIPSIPAQSSSVVPVKVENPEDCPVYCGRVIENIRTNAKTPDWMQERLRRVGLRCIHPIVDITNYVMMELGQPMHAFDMEIFDSSEIIVRRSRANEKLTLLDGDELDLGDQSLLITDHTGPVGLAGVMGGESSGIRSETTNIFLEAAFFTPQAIRRSVSRFGKHTDASHRFERGVEPLGQALAVERATALIQEITGGVPGPLQEEKDSNLLPKKQICMVRESRIARILGLSIPHDRIDAILRAVNHKVSLKDGGWEVLPHPYRFDLEKEHDQIEEVARIYGYNKIPSSMNFNANHSKGVSETTVKDSSVRNTLHLQGYYEAITYSFVDPELQKMIKPNTDAKVLANPLAENMSTMRTSLWPGLIGAFLENYRRNRDRIRFYEIGRVFMPNTEIDKLGGLCYGTFAPQQWGREERQIDFFDLKGDLMRLFDLTGKIDQVEFVAEDCDGLHPGCSAGIYLDQKRCGVAGQIHPDILNEIKHNEKVFAFELDIDVLLHRNLNQYSSISRFPSSIRDISILVPVNTPISEVSKEIKHIAGENLEKFTLFDVYLGSGIDSATKSIAYRFTFRSHTRTLTDAEVNSSLTNILEMLTQKFDAQLREQAG